MAGAESVSIDRLQAIRSVEAQEGYRLSLSWEDADDAIIDLTRTVKMTAFASLADPEVFRAVAVGDWGHSVVWPGDVEMGADSLWLDSLTAWGRDDTRAFLEWRLRNGLSLSGAAEALGLSRRTIAYYSGGRSVPRSILLACKGWDALKAA
jgi:hypothetical protein